MARLQHSLSSLRRWGCLHATPDALPAAGQALPGRIGYLQGPYERFQRWSLHVILLPQAFLAQTVSPFLPLTADAITTLAAGFDGSVRRVQTAYDALGNGYLVTSYNAGSGGSIVNQVEDIYNGLDQLVQEYQAHSGAVVVGTTPSVQYAYTEMSGGQNNSRLVSMTYPNGRVLDYNYNTGPDSNISRLSSISDGSATLESYLYLGLDTVVERDHPQDGVNMTYISQTGSTGDAGDQYTGLDRFGRVVEVNWYKPSTSTSIDDFKYGYDPDGNVMYMTNAVHPAFSELYHANGASNGYDGLNQLSAFARGTLSDTNSDGIPDTVASPSTSESWSLDALGNFSSVTLNGTPTSRTTNQQNEVTAVGSSSLAFDANGNTTTDDQGHTLIYDAWNRLIQVKSGGTVLATYSYDGLGRRVTENTGTLRDMYFSSAWQVVEEDAAGVMTNQYVWSPVYVNALIERDTPTQRLYVQQDADWNVTALVSVSGAAVERYLYDPYGAVTYLAGGWGSRSSSSYNWQYLFQGGRLSTATGLYNFQQRDYSPSLGRWVETDPSGFGGGDNNFYRAEGDNPVDSTDPAGLATASRATPTEAELAQQEAENQRSLAWDDGFERWMDRHAGEGIVNATGGIGEWTGPQPKILVRAGGALKLGWAATEYVASYGLFMAPEPVLTKVLGVGTFIDATNNLKWGWDDVTTGVPSRSPIATGVTEAAGDLGADHETAVAAGDDAQFASSLVGAAGTMGARAFEAAPGEGVAETETSPSSQNFYTNPKPRPDWGPLSFKKLRQFQDRGWTYRRVMDAFYKGRQEVTQNFANGNPATRYFHPRTGQFVVI